MKRWNIPAWLETIARAQLHQVIQAVFSRDGRLARRRQVVLEIVIVGNAAE